MVLHLNKLESTSPKDALCQRKWAHKTEIRQERWYIKKAEKLWTIHTRFLNAIRLTVFLNLGKLIKIYQNEFCFFKIWFWMGQYDPFHTIIDKFYFVLKKICCLWVLSPRIWNVLWMRFSKRNLKHQLKRWRDDPEIPKKIFFFSFFFLGWKYAKSKDMGLSFKSHLKHFILNDAVWLSGFASIK